MSYDIKFRERTIEYYNKGNSWSKTLETFGISSDTLNKWIKKKVAGDLSDKKVKKRKRKISAEKLHEYVDSKPDAYQSEMAEHFKCSQQAICQALKRNGITRKKRQNATKSKIL